MRRPALSALAALLALPLLPSGPDAYGAARLPDLVVSAVSAPASVDAGATLAVKVSVRNAGRARAGASTTTVHLSGDTRPGGDLVSRSVKVPRLGSGRTESATVRLEVPAGAAGDYRVLACADARKQVRESNERNNCRVATRAVTVVAPVDSEYPRTPNPLTVEPDPDEARAVTEMAYQHQDTTITATGADGTTYTLTIPAQALVAPEQITMTPVAAVGDLPLSGGLAAAVELKPHGLLLMKPAVLTIDGPDLGPLAQQTPFYFHGGGEDFHLYPPLPPRAGDGADVVRLPVLHFSTPGVGLGTTADRDAMADYPPSRLGGQITADIAELLRKEREDQLKGEEPDPDVGRQVVALLTEFYYAVVKPALVRAEANPRDRGAAFAAIDQALGWLRQMQLLGVGDDETDETPEMQDAMARFIRVAEAVYRDAWKQCSVEHGLEALPVLLRLARMAQLLGFPWGEEAFQRFLKCARFEVRFDSRITYSGTTPVGGENLYNYPVQHSGSWRAKTTAIVELAVNGAIQQAPLPLTEASYHSHYSYPRSDGSMCSGSSTQTGSVPGTLSTYAIPEIVKPNPAEILPGEEDTWREPVVNLLVVARPVQVKDTVRTVDCGGGDYTDTTTSRWLMQYNEFHEADPSLYRGTKADRSGDLMYAKTWDDSVSHPNHLGGEVWQETTVLEVWHKPAA
ncbi:hypothetical protein HNR19_004413 [Nocardioides thalensis]|uniref:CARDB domain-containing protein n=1 Tax=Nocardioides thalensis TaxID=1914755 RepID=A0A853C778_9ACTN|nr:CARDB domain-containing protein [Nocardioides thalensis]NYJ03715.1 hypothetical protein [Nocardioides thalensis]